MINQGPVVFLARGMLAPAGLPDAAAFAARSGRDVQMILRMPPRTEHVIFQKRIEMLRESLPDDLRQTPITGVHPKELHPTLHELAGAEGGLLALVPMRRGNPFRAVMPNDFERLLLDASLPVLALPPNGTLGPVRKILFPADFSPRSTAAFEQTIELCERADAELHLLHVFGPDRLLPSEQDLQRRQAAATPRELLAIDQEHLRSLGASASERGLRVVTATAEGRAHSAILRYIRAQQIDLVVMATHGPRTSEDILLGTTTTRVILASPVGVIGIQA